MQSSLLSHDWLTADDMFKWLTDILEWLVICLRQWPVATDQMISSSLNCPGTNHLNEWFVAEWIVEGLANWLNNFRLIELSGDWPTDWKIYGWLIDWITDSTVRQLTNWLNDLWLIDLLTNWLYSQDTDQLTESFMADWLTDLLTLLSKD